MSKLLKFKQHGHPAWPECAMQYTGANAADIIDYCERVVFIGDKLYLIDVRIVDNKALAGEIRYGEYIVRQKSDVVIISSGASTSKEHTYFRLPENDIYKYEIINE